MDAAGPGGSMDVRPCEFVGRDIWVFPISRSNSATATGLQPPRFGFAAGDPVRRGRWTQVISVERWMPNCSATCAVSLVAGFIREQCPFRRSIE